MKIKKGDNVIVISGKDKGKKGSVTKAFPALERVIVEGVNVRKKHQKPRQRGAKGQIVEIASPIHVSNVMIADPKTGTPTRIGMKVEGGKRIRLAKKSGASL